ncbi:unnamed protein product [Rotaria sp. Silwood2]|nr:unnamed protein product [Rotaria sp. Silwood2]
MEVSHNQAPLQQEYFDKYNAGGPLNWEIGRPQSAVLHLVQSGFFSGRVLDIGCGTGENARCIARQRNFSSPVKVVAVDLVPKAIEMAKKQTDPSEFTNLTFTVFDVLNEDNKTDLGRFNFVLDSCLFHGLSDEHRQIYIRQLHRWLKPGGVYVQLAWSEKETLERPSGPRKITRSDLEQLFSVNNEWQIESISDDILDSIPETNKGRSSAYLSLIRKL